MHVFARPRVLQAGPSLGADEAVVDQLISVSTEHGFSLWRTAGAILKSWLLTESGEPDRGLTEMRKAIIEWRGHDAKLFVPRWLLLLASALGRHDHLQEALDTIEEALALIDETSERWNEAELNLRRGELLISLQAHDKAEPCFQQAIAVARDQHAKLWELRAAMALARLWAEQDEPRKAHDLLAQIYGWFSEGSEMQDLKEARILLDTTS